MCAVSSPSGTARRIAEDDGLARQAGVIDALLWIVGELVIDLEASHSGKVITLRIEEEVVEKIRRCFESRRITGSQAPVDLDDRFVRGHRLVGY